jgi:quinol-cytochrome oxidoreductase complex cytochrome b subunit
MINLKETLLGGKPIQNGTLHIFAGLHVILAGVLLMKMTHMDLFWGVIALGAVVAIRGAIAVSQSGDTRTV